MRTFIAIELPENVKKEIMKIQQQLPEFKGKLTEKENLHLTLKFLGEVDEDKIKEIRKKLREIKLGKINAEIDAIGVFSEIFIKIIWLHIKGEGIEQLQREIDEKLSDLFDKEDRFMGHLTIARVKFVKNKQEFIEKLKNIQIPELSFKIEEFKLKKSVLKKQGPEYETLESYKLY